MIELLLRLGSKFKCWKRKCEAPVRAERSQATSEWNQIFFYWFVGDSYGKQN